MPRKPTVKPTPSKPVNWRDLSAADQDSIRMSLPQFKPVAYTWFDWVRCKGIWLCSRPRKVVPVKTDPPTLHPEVLYRHPLEHHMARVYDNPRPWGEMETEACVPCAVIPCPSFRAARSLVSFAKTADGQAFLHGSPH